jgi:hypothetical protein
VRRSPRATSPAKIYTLLILQGEGANAYDAEKTDEETAGETHDPSRWDVGGQRSMSAIAFLPSVVVDFAGHGSFQSGHDHRYHAMPIARCSPLAPAGSESSTQRTDWFHRPVIPQMDIMFYSRYAPKLEDVLRRRQYVQVSRRTTIRKCLKQLV